MSKMIRLAAVATVLLAMVSTAIVHAADAPAPGATPAATPAAPSAPAAAPATPAVAPATPSAPITTAPAPAAGSRTTEVVDNPYGLEALWRGGDIVARVTLGILAIMSMGSWYVIFTKMYEQAKLKRQARIANEKFWNAPSVTDGAAQLKDGSPFRFIAESGLEASQKHTGLRGNVSMNDWISMSIQRAMDNIQSRLQDGLAFLATVGSTRIGISITRG